MCNDSEPREEQILFIERLMNGIGISGTINDYIKKALEIDDKYAEEFIEQFKDNELKYNFVVDALVLISSLGSLEKKDVEFISEICEVIAISKEEIQFYSNMALGLVEQNSEKFIDPSDENLTLEKVERFKYYYKDFFKRVLIDNSRILYCYSSKKTELDFEKLYKEESVINFHHDEVIFLNQIINLENISLRFNNKNKITFINCEFTGGNGSIYIKSCKDFITKKCVFKEFNNRSIFNIEFIQNALFHDCDFKDCTSRNDKILGENINSIIIKECNFKNCIRVFSRYEKHAVALYSGNYGGNINIEKSKFQNCRSKGTTIQRTLFETNCEVKDCELIDSDHIC